MCNFIKGSLSKLSKFLNNKDKFITKEHFKDNFELLNEKTCFPYEFIYNLFILQKKIFIIKNYHQLKISIVL